MSSEQKILLLIDLLNSITSKKLEIEVIIPCDIDLISKEDPQYIANLINKIQLLNQLNSDVSFALQTNIQFNEKMKDYDLSHITNIIKKYFNTILEFNPSFMRTANKNMVLETIGLWNEFLRQNITSDHITGERQILFTMADLHHSGLSNLTYNFKNNTFYLCPFIYENVFDRGSEFKVEKENEKGFYKGRDLLEYRDRVDVEQLDFIARKDVECHNCEYSIACMQKKVLYYMKQKNVKKCILAKDIIDLFTRKSLK